MENEIMVNEPTNKNGKAAKALIAIGSGCLTSGLIIQSSDPNQKDPDEFKESIKKTLKAFVVICEHILQIMDEIK